MPIELVSTITWCLGRNVAKRMTDNDEYFEYLSRRSRLGALYRKCWLYPQLSRRLVGRTLDVGCGIGDMLAYRANTVGVDINPRTVAFCNARGSEAHLMNSDHLPFGPHEFESVLMDNVLEHLLDPAPLLAEVHRVLAVKGRLLIGVPGSKGWDSDPDHKVRYDEDSLVDTVQRLGFRHLETFHMPAWRSAWLDRMARQYCIYAVFERMA
jgi:SAM-dependent methyltransferase